MYGLIIVKNFRISPIHPPIEHLDPFTVYLLFAHTNWRCSHYYLQLLIRFDNLSEECERLSLQMADHASPFVVFQCLTWLEFYDLFSELKFMEKATHVQSIMYHGCSAWPGHV